MFPALSSFLSQLRPPLARSCHATPRSRASSIPHASFRFALFVSLCPTPLYPLLCVLFCQCSPVHHVALYPLRCCAAFARLARCTFSFSFLLALSLSLSLSVFFCFSLISALLLMHTLFARFLLCCFFFFVLCFLASQSSFSKDQPRTRLSIFSIVRISFVFTHPPISSRAFTVNP